MGIGPFTLYSGTTGIGNAAMGKNALYSNTTGAGNVAIGSYTTSNYRGAMELHDGGSHNVAIGSGALLAAGSASYNTAVGTNAGQDNNTGTITAVGAFALGDNTSGTSNVAVGGFDGSTVAALRLNTTGGSNTAVGVGAFGYNEGGNYNTGMGYQAGLNNVSGVRNTLIGYRAGRDLNNSYNVMLGYEAGRTTTSSGNTFIGTYAGFAATTGGNNTYVGSNGNFGSGHYMGSGSSNTFIGRYNGNEHGVDFRNESNLFIASDGNGQPSHMSQRYDTFVTGGRRYWENVIYEGAATGWDSSASTNTWVTVSAVNMNDGALFQLDGTVIKILVATSNLNPTYGYYSHSTAEFFNISSNTAYTGSTTATSMGDGSNGFELNVTSQCHTATSGLIFRMRIANVSGVGKRLQINSNIAPSSSAGAPTIKVSATTYDLFYA